MPLNFWNELVKLRGSGAMSISGFCTAHPGSTRPLLVTSVNLQGKPSVQFFVAYHSPWLTCLLINLEVLEGEGNYSLLKDLLKASPHSTALITHSLGSIPCSDRLLELVLVPHLQRISLDNFGVLAQLKKGRPVRPIYLYIVPFKYKRRDRPI